MNPNPIPTQIYTIPTPNPIPLHMNPNPESNPDSDSDSSFDSDSGFGIAPGLVSTAKYAHIAVAVYYKQTDYKQEHNKHYQYTVGAVLLARCSICTV